MPPVTLLPRDLRLLLTGATGLASRRRRHSPAKRQQLAERSLLPDTWLYPTTIMPPARCIGSIRCSSRWIAMLQSATVSNPSGCLNDLFPVGRGNHRRRHQRRTADARGKRHPVGRRLGGDGNIQRRGRAICHTSSKLSDSYTISDNYHQPAKGGTGLDSIFAGFGDAICYSDGKGNPTPPPTGQIENPDPQPGTNNV